MTTTAREFEGDLQDLLLAAADQPDGHLWPVTGRILDAVTFEAAGAGPEAHGLVVTLDDGTAWRLAIRPAR